MRLCDLDIPREKWLKLHVYNGDPDQMPHSAVSDLGLHCLPFTHLGVSRIKWVNQKFVFFFFQSVKVNRDIPMFQGHGTIDPLVSPVFGELTAGLIQTISSKHTFKKYPIMHTSCPEVRYTFLFLC